MRFTHSLVMAILFSKEPYLKRIQRIFLNAYEHGRRLGLYVFLYKSIVCILNRLRGVHTPVNNFVAGCAASFVVWREETNISSQITLYLLSRVLIGCLRLGYMKTGIRNKILEKYSISFLALISWSSIMFLFDYDKNVMQNSLVTSMKFLYMDSDRWNGWKQCLLGTFKKIFKS